VEKQKEYIIYGSGSVLITSTFFIILAIIFPKYVGKLFFGHVYTKPLLLGTMTLLFGHILHMLTYASYRGKMQIKYANLLQFLNIGILPLFVAIFLGRTKSYIILLVMGIGTILISSVLFLYHFLKSFNILRFLSKDTRDELFKYSLPRIPADIGLGLIFLFGPWASVRIGDVRGAGYLAISQAILNVLGAVLDSISLVALPYFSKLSSSSDRQQLRTNIIVLTAIALHIGIFFSIQLFIFADWITVLWCGKEYTPAIPFMRITLLSAGLYVIYVSLRGIIDAVVIKAINTRNIWISFAFGIVSSIICLTFDMHSLSFAVGFATGLSTLGLLSVIYIHRRFSLKMPDYNLEISLFLNLAFVFIVIVFKHFLQPGYLTVLLLILLELIFLLVYIKILKTINPFWFRDIIKRINYGR